IDAAASKLAHRRRQAIRIIVLDEVDREVAAFDIAKLAQPLFKGGVLGQRAPVSRNDTNMEDAAWRFVGTRGGDGGKTDQQSRTKEPAGAHSITSSARPRTDSGMVRPSAFAVFRLTISSNFVGCWTGRSAGLAPFGIWSI